MKTYMVNDEIDTCDRVTAASAEEALKIAKRNIDPNDYAWDGRRPLSIDVTVTPLDADGEPDSGDTDWASGTVTFEPFDCENEDEVA